MAVFYFYAECWFFFLPFLNLCTQIRCLQNQYTDLKSALDQPLDCPMVRAEGVKFFILITLNRWKRHFREKNYIKNYFYLLKSTTSTKTTSQKCWRNVIWVDFWGSPYRTGSIKTHLGLPVQDYTHFVFYAGFPHPLCFLCWFPMKYVRGFN